jgi:hypothetical protein
LRTTEQLRDYQNRSRQACEGFLQALYRPMFQIYSEDTVGFLNALRAVGAIAQRPDHRV